MNAPVIIDAGPALNFLSINKERLLLSVVGPQGLSAPETVDREVQSKAARDPRFGAATRIWATIKKYKYVHILQDDATNPSLAEAVQRIGGQPMASRKRQSKDLGELMVVAHAAVLTRSGVDVTVIVDDGDGQDLVVNEAEALDGLRSSGTACGCLYLMTTADVLADGAGTEHLPGKSEMRDVYRRLRGVDNGLVPIEQTGLLDLDIWRSAAS